MEISLDLVTEAARRRLAAVSPEVAGYIVLLATRELEARLFRVSPANLALSETGEVRAHPEGCMSEREVEAALRQLLASLLSLSPSPAPAVVAVAERAGSAGLRALSAELTAALIPINHAAAQRALARLFRETRRARDAVTALEEAAPQPLGAPSTGAETAPDDAARVAPSGADFEIEVEVEPGPFEAAPPRAAAALAAAPAAPSNDAAAELPSDLPPSAPPGASAAGGLPSAGAITPPPNDELDEGGSEDVERHADDGSTPAAFARPPSIPAPVEIDVVGLDVKSDVNALIAAFLSHTRSEPAMTRALRRLVGLEPPLELATS